MYMYDKRDYVSLNGSFMEGFMALNIINFAVVGRKEKHGVSWDVRG